MSLALEPERLTIGLIGPCGSGKSTLSAAFSILPDVDVVLELPPKILGLNIPYFSLDIAGIQREFLEMRLEQARAARSRMLILDRTVGEDRNVFLRLHYELGGLTSTEMEQLDKLAEYTETIIGVPDALVVLRANPEILQLRIGNQARPDWLVSSFGRQLDLYADLISNINGTILEIDTTLLSVKDLSKIAIWIIKTVHRARHSVDTELLGGTDLGLRWVVR